MRLLFQAGTLEFDGLPPGGPPEVLLPFVKADPRTGTFRARACDYAEIVMSLCRAGIPFEDRAKGFSPIDGLELREKITLRPHQEKALSAWRNNNCRGVAALPTGSGKTILAVSAIALLKRPAFVMVPTIDLLTQWAGVLERFLGRRIGMLGGGSREIREITVSTYDSAVLNMEFIGDRFGFLIADECHHLPGPETRLAAAMSLAPFRLGLSATPELPEDRAAVLEDLMGPVVCRVGIGELEGKVYAALPAGMETTVQMSVGEQMVTSVEFGSVDYPANTPMRFEFHGKGLILFDKKSGKKLGRGSAVLQ